MHNMNDAYVVQTEFEPRVKPLRFLHCGKVFRIGTVHYNWPMSAHTPQAFSIAHDSEDLPHCVHKAVNHALVSNGFIMHRVPCTFGSRSLAHNWSTAWRHLLPTTPMT